MGRRCLTQRRAGTSRTWRSLRTSAVCTDRPPNKRTMLRPSIASSECRERGNGRGPWVLSSRHSRLPLEPTLSFQRSARGCRCQLCPPPLPLAYGLFTLLREAERALTTEMSGRGEAEGRDAAVSSWAEVRNVSSVVGCSVGAVLYREAKRSWSISAISSASRGERRLGGSSSGRVGGWPLEGTQGEPLEGACTEGRWAGSGLGEAPCAAGRRTRAGEGRRRWAGGGFACA